MTARIFIVDDHPLLREVIADYVARMPEAMVCGAAASAEEALVEIDELRPDLAIVDLSLPSMSGFDLVGELASRCPDVLCLILTGHGEPSYRRRARELGCSFVLKDDPDELPVAIRAALAGRPYESPTEVP